MHENVTCKYVEVNSTGKKHVDRANMTNKAKRLCLGGGGRRTPAAMFLPSLIDQLMEEGRACPVFQNRILST